MKKVNCNKCGSLSIKGRHGSGCYSCGNDLSAMSGEIHQLKACPVCNGSLTRSECLQCAQEPYQVRLSRLSVDPRSAPVPSGRLYNNVGNCLAKLIPEWAVGSKKGCKCKDIQDKLNSWGTKGCEDNIEWIVTKMVGQKKYLRGALKMVPDGVAEGGVRWLVAKAIKMSKEK